MIAEAIPTNDLLEIKLTSSELESIDAHTLNDRIRKSFEKVILINPQDIEPKIPIEKALSRFRIGGTIQMIVFSGGAWPILFTYRAWNELRGFQEEGQGAERIVSGFLAHARKARIFTVMQVGK